MKKFFSIFLGVIVILSGSGYLVYTKASFILAQTLSRATGASVTIQNIQFHTRSFIINYLQISNPKTSRLPTALQAEKITVSTPYYQYVKNPIVIDKVDLNNVYVNIEIYNKEETEGNWYTIIHNMEKKHFSPLSIQRPAIIKKLVLTNINIDLILPDGKLQRLSPINRLEFNDINSEEGIPTQEISEVIVQKMMHSILIEKGLKTIIEAPIDIIKKVFPFL